MVLADAKQYDLALVEGVPDESSLKELARDSSVVIGLGVPPKWDELLEAANAPAEFQASNLDL